MEFTAIKVHIGPGTIGYKLELATNTLHIYIPDRGKKIPDDVEKGEILEDYTTWVMCGETPLQIDSPSPAIFHSDMRTLLHCVKCGEQTEVRTFLSNSKDQKAELCHCNSCTAEYVMHTFGYAAFRLAKALSTSPMTMQAYAALNDSSLRDGDDVFYRDIANQEWAAAAAWLHSGEWDFEHNEKVRLETWLRGQGYAILLGLSIPEIHDKWLLYIEKIV